MHIRIGPVFDFQDRVGRLLSWKKPTQTLSFLAIYSFVCLNPYLLAVLPLASVLFFIMVPAFLARHPPPPTSSSGGSSDYSYEGPALAPAKTIKPASETSKDFFQNMRDLQNSMADFSDLHDALVKTLAPPTNFSDEKRSSEIFILLTAVTASLFLVAHMLPWRVIFLIGGNLYVISNYSGVQRFLQSTDRDKDSSAKTEQKSKAPADQSNPLAALASPINPIVESLANISLDSTLEEREVEIFELQHRSISPHSSGEWETVLFSPSPYDPLSPSRIAGDRPRGCRHFEDVQPPPGWAWKSKKWELDIECRAWVMERMITGVGFEVPGVSDISNDGPEDHIGGWVWDLPPDGDHSNTSDGPSDMGSVKSFKSDKIRGKAKEFPVLDWEASSQFQGAGEWRRRRWVRTVHRTSVTNDKNARDGPDRD